MDGQTLKGRKALVTGGASGIGAACARKLAALGAEVTVADLDGEGAARVARELGGNAWRVDLGDTAALARAPVDADVLVNNAGIQHVSPVQEFPPEKFALMLRIMVEAPFLLIRAALPDEVDTRSASFVVSGMSTARPTRRPCSKSSYACFTALRG